MSTSRRERLEAELHEVRAQVSRLESELERIVDEEQHDSIDHLDEYFDAVDSRFKGLKIFLKSLFEESKSEVSPDGREIAESDS